MRTTMLVHDIDISCLMMDTQQIDEEKFKERSREAKRARVNDDNYSHSRSGGQGRSRFQIMFSVQGSTISPPSPNNERVSNLNLKEMVIGLRCLLVLNMGKIIK